MRRRGFLGALLGAFTVPLFGRVPVPEVVTHPELKVQAAARIPGSITYAYFDVQRIRDRNILLRMDDYTVPPARTK